MLSWIHPWECVDKEIRSSANENIYLKLYIVVSCTPQMSFYQGFQQQPHGKASREIVLAPHLLPPNDILVTKLFHANAEDVCLSAEWEKERSWKLLVCLPKHCCRQVITICHDSVLLSRSGHAYCFLVGYSIFHVHPTTLGKNSLN